MNDERKRLPPMMKKNKKKKFSSDSQQQQQQQVVGQTRSSSRLRNSWRKSFDRFGDDLTQLLLSYLSVRQRFQYECLCRQWHRVIYRSVIILDIDYLYNVKDGQKNLTAKQLDTIKTIVRKCSNISFVFITISKPFVGKVVEMIAEMCPNVTKLSISSMTGYKSDLSVYTMDQFFDKYRQQLKSLSYFGLTKQFDGCVCRHFRQSLKQLTELNIINYEDDNNIFAALFADQTNREFGRQLKTIQFICKSSTDLKSYDNFVDICANSLTKVYVVIKENLDLLSLKTLITGLSRLTQLNDLMITQEWYILQDLDYPLPSVRVFVDHLKLIGFKCRQLRKLSLGVTLLPEDTHILFDTINNHFRHLRRLEIPCSSTNFDIQSLNQMKLLRHLALDGCNWELQDNYFFVILVHQLPQLVCLSNMVIPWTPTDSINPFRRQYFLSDDNSRDDRQTIDVDIRVDQLSQLLANISSKQQLRCLQTYYGKRYLLKYR